jgi:hypothetical protein
MLRPMTDVRRLLLIGLCTGCASGSARQAGDDASVTPDSPVADANEEVFVDAAVDAGVDAALPPDATVLPPDAAPPDACVPVATEKLANPALDLVPQGVGWVDGRDPAVNLLPGGPFPIISPNPTGLTAHSVPNKAWFGGAAGVDVNPPKPSLIDQLHQDITFPADATNFVVSGFFLVGTNESGSTVFDTFSIDVTETNGTPIENVLTATNATVADAFTPFSKTLTSNLAGRTVRLRLISINDDILHTNFFLDSLSLQATHCP